MSRITFSFAHSGGTSFARSVLPPVFRVEVVAAGFVRFKNMSPNPELERNIVLCYEASFHSAHDTTVAPNNSKQLNGATDAMKNKPFENV